MIKKIKFLTKIFQQIFSEYFIKKNISNIIFTIVLIVMLIPSSRVWILRQIAFSPSIKNSREAKKIETYNWQLNGVTAESINFTQLEGKVVLVNFWATWCPPCRAELPMMQKLYNDYKDKIAFVLVTDENREKVISFFNKNGYNFPVYNSISNPPSNFSETNSIPTSFLIDENGNILISKTGAANWNSKKVRNLIDKLLKK